MPSLVVMIILVAAIVIPSAGWWQASARLKVCKAESKSFQDNVQLEGERADKQRVETETRLAQAAVNIQGDLNDARQVRDNNYAAYLKLLNDKTRSRSGKAVANSDAAIRLACPDSTAEFNSAMAGFENEVVRQILKTRDEAISRNIACKAYLEQITAIAGEK